MSPFILSVLKYALLVLLYFFVYRAIRSVVVDVAGRRGAPRSTARPATSSREASRGARPPSSVIVHQPDAAGPSTIGLGDPTDVGRGATCAISVDDTYVSQQHARFFTRDGRWFVEDLGSTNGTYLNDRRVSQPAEVHAGDVVRLGKTVLELRR